MVCEILADNSIANIKNYRWDLKKKIEFKRQYPKNLHNLFYSMKRHFSFIANNFTIIKKKFKPSEKNRKGKIIDRDSISLSIFSPTSTNLWSVIEPTCHCELKNVKWENIQRIFRNRYFRRTAKQNRQRNRSSSLGLNTSLGDLLAKKYVELTGFIRAESIIILLGSFDIIKLFDCFTLSL